MRSLKLAMLLGLVIILAAVIMPTAFAASGTATVQPQVIDDSQIQALTTTIGGASVLPTTRTIPHWFGQTLNPQNGVLYGYNMVGADPNNCSGSKMYSPRFLPRRNSRGMITAQRRLQPPQAPFHSPRR